MEFIQMLYKKYIAIDGTMWEKIKCSNKLKLLRRLLSYSLLIISIGILIICSIWSFVWYQINNDYDRTIEIAYIETMNLAIAYEEHVRRIVSEVDRDLVNLKKIYERDGILSPLILDFVNNVANDTARNQVAIYNEQGFRISSITKSLPVLDYSDRAYFQVHRDKATDTLFIGQPIQVRLGLRQNTIPLSRRINKPDGSFAGIVYIGLKSDYFLEFYKKMNLGQNQLIALTGTDGFNRVRRSGDNYISGQDTRGSEFWRRVQTGHPYETYIADNYLDGVSRVMSYRVMPDYPLIISVAKSTQVILVGYEQRKKVYVLVALLVSLAIIVFCSLMIKWSKKQRALNVDLERCVDERTQEIIRKSQLLDLAHDFIIVSDLDGKIIYWNRGAELGYGWSQGEALGQNKYSLLKTDFPKSAEDIMDCLLVVGHWGGELVHISKESNSIFVRSHQTLTRDAKGNPFSILEINYDITEKKKFDAELARMDRLNLIGEMAAGIGHEVRNPMTTVRGYLQWFNQKDAFVDHRESFAIMIEELDRANSIITEFLSLAKDKKVYLVLIDLNKIIRSVFPLLQADAFLRGNSIELELLDTLELFMDEKEIRQCILNLVGNGLDSMPNGGKVTISTKRVGNQVVMTVRDEGLGMTPEVKAKLWTPFFTTKEKGTGLGLSVCYQIAQRHEATIEVETGPEGTVFHFIFNQKRLVK